MGDSSGFDKRRRLEALDLAIKAGAPGESNDFLIKRAIKIEKYLREGEL